MMQVIVAWVGILAVPFMGVIFAMVMNAVEALVGPSDDSLTGEP